MTLKRTISSAIPGMKSGAQFKDSQIRALSRRVDELAGFLSLEAQAYSDAKIEEFRKVVPTQLSGDGAAGSGTSRADLERLARLSVDEAKAYADVSVSNFANSISAMARTLVDLRKRLSKLEESNEPANTSAALEDRIAALKATVSSLPAGTGEETTNSLRVALDGVTTGLEKLNDVLDQIEEGLSNLSAEPGSNAREPES